MSVKLTCDLRASFGAIRDQGQRPTCLAFAVSDAHAFAYQPFKPFSVEYLYYHALRRMPGAAPGSAASEQATAVALLRDGQPHEHECPYLTYPPTSIPINSRAFRRNMPVDKKCFERICRSLDSGSPVVACLWISESFYLPDARGVVAQIQGDRDTTVHAVVVVGHGETTKERCILIRNSWGTTWGLSGHGFIEKSYMEKRVTSTSVIS